MAAVAAVQLAQAGSIEVVAADDALVEPGHVLARAAHVGDPVDDEVERDRGVDAELPARREVEPDGEHVGGVQLEVPPVSGDGVRLAGVEVARQVVVRQRGRVDRGQRLVGGDRGRSFGCEVGARDLTPGSLLAAPRAATRLRRRKAGHQPGQQPHERARRDRVRRRGRSTARGGGTGSRARCASVTVRTGNPTALAYASMPTSKLAREDALVLGGERTVEVVGEPGPFARARCDPW